MKLKTKVYDRVCDDGRSWLALVTVDTRRGVREILRGGLPYRRDGDGKTDPRQKVVVWRDEMKSLHGKVY